MYLCFGLIPDSDGIGCVIRDDRLDIFSRLALDILTGFCSVITGSSRTNQNPEISKSICSGTTFGGKGRSIPQK